VIPSHLAGVLKSSLGSSQTKPKPDLATQGLAHVLVSPSLVKPSPSQAQHITTSKLSTSTHWSSRQCISNMISPFSQPWKCRTIIFKFNTLRAQELESKSSLISTDSSCNLTSMGVSLSYNILVCICEMWFVGHTDSCRCCHCAWTSQQQPDLRFCSKTSWLIWCKILQKPTFVYQPKDYFFDILT